MDLGTTAATITPFPRTVPAAANTLPAGQAHGNPLAEAARQTAIEFEAVFLSQMLAPMFEGLGKDPLFGGGPGEDIYRSMLVEEYSNSIARTGGIGIADAVQREILRLQEASQP